MGVVDRVARIPTYLIQTAMAGNASTYVCVALVALAVFLVWGDSSWESTVVAAERRPVNPASLTARQGSNGDRVAGSPPRALFATYCVTCHSDRLKISGLSLEKVNPTDAGASAPVLERVVRKLRAGAMPPEGLPRPDKATLDAFV